MNRKTEKVWKTQKLCLGWEEHRPSRIYTLKILKSCFKCLHYGCFWQISGEFLVIKLKIPKWWHSETSALHNLSEIGLTSKANENKNKNQEDSFISESRSVSSVTESWPQGLQHARTPCPSPTPGAYSNSCPLSRWCYPTISSFVFPFSSHLQSFPASGSFQRSHFFCIRWPKYWSFSFSISPSNEYSGLISFGWTDLIYLSSPRGSQVFSNTTVQKHQRIGVTCKFLETISSVRLLVQGEASENEFISWVGNWLVYVLTQSKSIDLNLKWSCLAWSDFFFSKHSVSSLTMTNFHMFSCMLATPFGVPVDRFSDR